MNQIRALLFIFLAGCAVLGTTGCVSDPEWIRPREGTYPGPSKAAADRPPGTCQQHNAEGVLVTIPCSELRTIITSGVVGADASAAPAAPAAPKAKANGECYVRLGDGTKRPIFCEHAGTAWRWFHSNDSPEGGAQRKQSLAE